MIKNLFLKNAVLKMALKSFIISKLEDQVSSALDVPKVKYLGGKEQQQTTRKKSVKRRPPDE